MSGADGQRRKDFAAVPSAAILDTSLSHAEIRALAVVAAMRNFKTGWTTCGTRALAEAMGLTPTKANQHYFRTLIGKLVDLRYIDVKKFPLSTIGLARTEYRVILDAPEPRREDSDEDGSDDDDFDSGSTAGKLHAIQKGGIRGSEPLMTACGGDASMAGNLPATKVQSLSSEDSQKRKRIAAQSNARGALDDRFAALLSETEKEDLGAESPKAPSPQIAPAPLPRAETAGAAPEVGPAPEVRRKARKAPADLKTEDSGGLMTKGIAIPAWVPVGPWQDYVELREAKKRQAPFTPGAVKRTIADLEKIRGAGDDPGEVLGQSVQRGWTGVFPLRKDSAALRQTEKGGKLDWLDKYQSPPAPEDSGSIIEGSLA